MMLYLRFLAWAVAIHFVVLAVLYLLVPESRGYYEQADPVAMVVAPLMVSAFIALIALGVGWLASLPGKQEQARKERRRRIGGYATLGVWALWSALPILFVMDTGSGVGGGARSGGSSQSQQLEDPDDMLVGQVFQPEACGLSVKFPETPDVTTKDNVASAFVVHNDTVYSARCKIGDMNEENIRRAVVDEMRRYDVPVQVNQIDKTATPWTIMGKGGRYTQTGEIVFEVQGKAWKSSMFLLVVKYEGRRPDAADAFFASIKAGS